MTSFDATGGGGDNTTRNATVNLNANTSAYQANMAAAGRQTSTLAGVVDNLSSKLDGLSKRAGRKLELFAGADFAALAGFTASAAAFDKQLSTLRATNAVTGTSFGGLKKDVEDTFTKFPIARSEAAALTTAISNMGVTGVRDIGSLTNTFVKLGAATGEPMTQLASGLIQLSRLMGTTNATTIGNYGNALLTSAKKAGVSAAGVLEFSQSIAPMARQAGIGEAAVIGISTAFSKAGADGFVAANVFNGIVNDITNLTKTGSPALAKYANFIGTTADQFKKLPGQDQITKLFAAVAQGGPKALAFANELGLGTRGLSALQAVAQSGGLKDQIATAVGASGDQKNLNKASDAAFNNLGDTLTKVRNQFTEFGDIIAGPVLKPLNMLATGLGGMLSVVNSVIKHMGPLPAIAMAAAGSLAVIAGIALAHAGAIAGLAAVRTFTSTGPRRALREGREFGATGTANASSRMRDEGTMPLRARVPFYLGTKQGERSAAADPAAPVGARGAFMAGLRSRTTPTPTPTPGPAAATARAEAAAARFRSGPGAVAAGMAVKTGLGVPAYLIRGQGTMLHDSRVPDYQRTPYLGRVGTTGPAAMNVAAQSALMKARLAEAGIIKVTAQEAGALAKAMIGTAAETTKAGMAMARAAAVAGTRGTTGAILPGPAARVANAGGRGLAAVGRGVGMVGRAAFSLPGMLALGIGVPLAMGAMHSFQDKQRASSQVGVLENLNPLAKYNDALGIATTNLASFSSGLKDATPKAGQASTATTFAGAQTVSSSDIANFAHGKSSDKNLSALNKYGGKDKVEAAKQLLGSYGITDPKQLDLFKQNLLASGFSTTDAADVLNSYKPGAQPDTAAIAKTINSSQNKGMFATNASGSGNTLIGATLSGFGTTKNTDMLSHSAGFATTKELQSQLQLLTEQAKGAKGTGIAALANTFATVTGGSQNTFKDLLRPGSGRDPGGKDAFSKDNFNAMSEAGKQKFIMKVITDSSHGRNLLDSISGAGGETDPTKISDFLNKNFGVASESQTSMAYSSGALGKFATTNKGVLDASGAQSGNPAAVQAATEALSGTAGKLAHGDMSKAAGSLMSLSDAMGGADTTTGRLIASAAAWSRTLQSFRTPTLSRNAQLGESIHTYQASQRAANTPGASQATIDQAKTDKTAYEGKKEEERQFLMSVGQQAQQFGIQMQRAEYDRGVQLVRQKRDFDRQMLQSEQDYELQTLYSKEDFTKQLKRQAESSAQTIYNPFTRVQAQYTTDAGTLLQNLQDQNERIRQQFAQLQQLRNAGVSQAAIDTLQLSDPNNAQQVNNIVGSLAQNPQLVAKINSAVGKRVAATTALTQSSFTMTFRNTVDDFTVGLNRASTAYQTAHDRAVQAQHIALGDMSTDYNLMVSRSGEDLKLSMTELYGSFGKTFARTTDLVTKYIGKYAPDAANMIDKSLQELKAKYPALWDDHFAGASPATPTHTPGPSFGPNAANPGTRDHTTGAPKANTHGPHPKLTADGIIATSAQERVFGEAGPEAAIPLDGQRGIAFMSGMYQAVARSVVMQMHTSAHPTMPQGPSSSSITYDQSTVVTGNNFELIGSTAAEVLKEIKDKDRLGKLTSPVRH